MKNAMLFTAMLYAVSLAAQNLVPNHDFEQLKKEPCNYMQFDIEQYIHNWNQGGYGTSDIVCDNIARGCNASMSEGSSGFGTETPHSGHTAGMIRTFMGNQYREYLGNTLTSPLVKGKRYYVEFFVSACDRNTSFTNNIGICFFTGAYKVSPEQTLLGKPQVNYSKVITQTEGWLKISGTFTADENYSWFVIGNFYSNEQTIAQNKTGAVTPYGNACYYLDDVTVKAESNLAVTGDTLVSPGVKATLTASGGTKFQWADSRSPKVIIGNTDILTIAVSKKTTFYVYSGSDTAVITVNVRKLNDVYLTEIEGRKVRKGRTVYVHNETITIQVHDKNEIDGDSIALYYGDSLVAEHVLLAKRKQSFTIQVDKNSPRQIILYAENLGSVPPNTAALTIRDGRNSTDVVLGSDYKFCDSVLIAYKEE